MVQVSSSLFTFHSSPLIDGNSGETILTAHAHAAHLDAAHLETSTGLDNRKLAIWTFIGSECMFFATLISNYLVNKGRSLVGPYPHEPWTDPATGKVLAPIIEI